jgi:hypothetical protein
LRVELRIGEQFEQTPLRLSSETAAP